MNKTQITNYIHYIMGILVGVFATSIFVVTNYLTYLISSSIFAVSIYFIMLWWFNKNEN